MAQILLVEDNEMNRDMLSRRLTKRGFEIQIAINGKDIPYGLFIGEVVNFLVVALALYLFIVKFLGFVMKEKKAEAAAPPAPSKEEVLLTEIRDLLSKGKP